MKKAGIVMGSDLPVVEKAVTTLKELDVPCEVHVFSAHRTPEKAGEFARTARENGFGVLIAAAGMAALAKGVKVTGATVHFVNEIPDGGEIIMQKAVDVLDGDTPEVLQKRVMEQAEWKILPAAAEKISEQIMKGR